MIGFAFPNEPCAHTQPFKKNRPIRLNGSVFVYELIGYGFKSRCSYLNFRYRPCFEQRVPRY